jgi:tRNA nucleotidyltransferase (CCA-adding enzyme)
VDRPRVPKGNPVTGGRFTEFRHPEGLSLGHRLPLDRSTQATLDTLVTDLHESGGSVTVVGGSVRDMLLGLPSHDLDLEVAGLDLETVHEIVANKFSLDVTGANFSVLKVKVPGSADVIDLALPRTEEVTGSKHTDFDVRADKDLDFETAASRRDFTINAMGLDPLTGELLDPFGGEADLRAGIIKHVSDKFSEDALRPLRAARFAGRFGFDIDQSTVDLCQNMRPLAEHLPPERVWGELVGILQSQSPGTALHALNNIGWIDVFPEVAALRGVEQDAGWHPEGDVFVHTAHVLDYADAHRIGDEHDDLVVAVAAMCHDLGKANTTKFFDGRFRSHGHEEAGVPLTQSLLKRLGQLRLTDEVTPLVEHHLAPVTLTTDKAIRRLSTKVPRLDLLAQLSRADSGGRPPLANSEAFDKIDAFSERVKNLDLRDGPPKGLVNGRHLIALGLEPGVRFKEYLGAVYDAQLDGVVTTEAEALVMLRGLISS